MSDVLVSVIMRTKDRPILLRRAVESVVQQTYPEWELIIVNDAGDRDPVEAIVDNHGTVNGTIRLLHRERSFGMEAATNAGIQISSGEYLTIHDDDDSWEPGFLEECVGHIEKVREPDVQGVVTHSTRVNEVIRAEHIEVTKREPYNPWLSEVAIFSMCIGNLFPPISFLYRRKALEVTGLYNENLPVLGDWEFNMRFLLKHSIDVIPKLLANYHYRTRLMRGVYSNTVVGGLDLHARYDMRIRNDLLRGDLAKGRAGLGWLVNVAKRCGEKTSIGHDDAVAETQNRLLTELVVNIRKKGLYRIAVFGAGVTGKSFGKLSALMGLKISCYIDSNPRLWGSRIEGIEVISLQQAVHDGQNEIAIASFAFADEIRETIRERYVAADRKVAICDPFDVSEI